MKLSVERPGREQALADATTVDTLHDLTPEQVFRSLYRRAQAQREPDREPGPERSRELERESEPESEPEPELIEAFHELVDLVGQQDGGG